MNQRQVPVIVQSKLQISGTFGAAAKGSKRSLSTEMSVGSLNPTTTATWETEVEAGSKIVIPYSYSFKEVEFSYGR